MEVFVIMAVSKGILWRTKGRLKKKINLTRRQKIGYGLGVIGVLVLIPVGICLYFLNEFVSGWQTSTQVTTRLASPDGAYVATVTEWNAGGFGGSSILEIKPMRPSSFSVRFSRLFANTYTDNFEQLDSIRWTQKRTLKVKYMCVPGDENHQDSWGDIHFDYVPISAK